MLGWKDMETLNRRQSMHVGNVQQQHVMHVESQSRASAPIKVFPTLIFPEFPRILTGKHGKSRLISLPTTLPTSNKTSSRPAFGKKPYGNARLLSDRQLLKQGTNFLTNEKSTSINQNDQP